MDKNAHKRSLFELYSSEEKIIDVDRLQEDYESESTLSSSSFEDSNKKCAIFGLEESDTFENWDLAERQVENYSKEVGFGIVRRRINKNRHGEIKRRTFECQNSRKYCAKKRADVEETRERESVKIGCPWKVNLSCNKGVIRVTSICKKHNHPLFGNRNIASDRHLSPEMLEEIEFLVNVGCEAGLIICMLQKWFPDAVIHPKNVYNAICLFRRDQKVMKTDAAETYDKLIKMQREEHEWNKCRNSFSEEEFQRRWHGLLKNYPEAQKYLERALGTDVTGWALCFTHRSFNAGVQSTQRVESYNALIKKSVGSSTTLYELDIQIQLQFDKEEKFERLEEQVNQNPTIGLPNVIKRYFKRIDGIIKKYLTPQVLKIQHGQMNESLLYCVKKIENWEHLLEREWERSNKKEREGYDDYEWERYDNDELERYDDKGSDEKDSKVKFAEDDYESKLTQEELAVTVCGKKYASDDGKLVYEHQVLTNFDILNEIRHTQLFSETVKQNLSRKAKYNEGFDYAKRAIGLSLELRCENEINEILQSWIRKKEIEIRNRQLGRIIGSKENLPNISNPHHQTRTKGAPKKRVKNALENTTIKYSNNKNRQDIKKLNDKHHEKSIKELNKQPRNELQREISIHQTKYICSYCKGSGHNVRSCELKKKVLRQELDKQMFLI
ncbi:14424_t:CDS:2 [Rhizophagus irregularis]|nr:14424_t:CDS:2 [Rhizophagus irregularis]